MENDPNFYVNGANRMVSEGTESVSKIMAFIKMHENKLASLSPAERKKYVLEFEPSKLFNQIHPIVFHYIAVEGIFNANAFKRYIFAVFGKPKDQSQMEQMRGNKKLVYRFKNAQQALYYKYMLIDANPNVKKNIIHGMYEEVVASLNKDTDDMLDAYDRAQDEANVVEEELTVSKKKDLIEMLQRKFTHTN